MFYIIFNIPIILYFSVKAAYKKQPCLCQNIYTSICVRLSNENKHEMAAITLLSVFSLKYFYLLIYERYRTLLPQRGSSLN